MTLAILPAQMLYVAAQFASIDLAKQVLTGILVRPAKGGGVTIDSTNGIGAFNVTCSDPIWHCDTPLLLNAKSFAKRIGYAKTVNIEANEGLASFLGGKNSIIELMQAVPWRWQSEGFKGDPVAQYPDIDSLWPGKFNNSPGQPVGFNARLMADFLKQVERYSWNGVAKMELNGATNPFVLTSVVADYGLSSVEMRYLLCPVQIKAEA
jgi:hypothetical protein